MNTFDRRRHHILSPIPSPIGELALPYVAGGQSFPKVAASVRSPLGSKRDVTTTSRGIRRVVSAAAAAVMGRLARLVDGIKARLSRKKKNEDEEEEAAACYGKVDKTDSMRVEIRSRRAQELISKNLAAADSLGRRGGGNKNKKRFFAF